MKTVSKDQREIDLKKWSLSGRRGVLSHKRARVHNNFKIEHLTLQREVYFLDPALQQGCKILKWQPRSCCGIFVGFSIKNSIHVPLILRRATVHISPKFHLIFDDSFRTVLYIYNEKEPRSFWNEFDLSDFLHSTPLNDKTQDYLNVDLCTPY